jgi:peroxiredoxin
MSTLAPLTLKDSQHSITIPNDLKQTTLLYFMRTANCPVCLQNVRQLQKLLPEFQTHQIVIIVIVPDSIEAAGAVKQKNSLTMPVLFGNGDAHALAGFDKKMFGMMQQSGSLLVDQTGEILSQKIATNPMQSFRKSDLEALLAAK